MMSEINSSRRSFLKNSGVMAGVTSTSVFGLLSAISEQANAQVVGSDYRALVCVFMAGGNDAYNTIIPTAPRKEKGADGAFSIPPNAIRTPRRQKYEALRGGRQLALDPYRELQQDPGTSAEYMVAKVIGDDMAFNPNLAGLAQIYGRGRLAVVANVGPNFKSTATNESTSEVPKVYSHNDQISVWLTGAEEGKKDGYGGLTEEAVEAAPGTYSVICLGQQSAFCATSTGATGVSPMVVSPAAGVLRPWCETASGPLPGGAPTGMTDYEWQWVYNAEEVVWPIMEGKRLDDSSAVPTPANLFEAEYASRLKNTQARWKEFATMTSTDPQPGPSSDPLNWSLKDRYLSGLEEQLNTVAWFIAKQRAGKIPGSPQRQVFFVQIGGFDTHSNQLSTHNGLMAGLNKGLASFHDKLEAMGALDSVTTFTMSDFGRALRTNDSGTDHGWGGHHFVMGGKVNGGAGGGAGYYGQFPKIESTSWSPQNGLLPTGVMFPAVSTVQYLWPLAKWFGVTDAKRDQVFGSGRYWAPTVDVNFMKA